jgi:hypothetical protein
VAERTNIPQEIVRVAVDGLRASNLVRAEGAISDACFRYAPATAALALASDRLALAFQENRATIISLMSRHAIDRVRSGAMRAFADSFILGKKDSEDG